MWLTQACNCFAGCSLGGFDSAGWNVALWPYPEVIGSSPSSGHGGTAEEICSLRVLLFVTLCSHRENWESALGAWQLLRTAQYSLRKWLILPVDDHTIRSGAEAVCPISASRPECGRQAVWNQRPDRAVRVVRQKGDVRTKDLNRYWQGDRICDKGLLIKIAAMGATGQNVRAA